ncbi:MAG: DUF3619 family protein [Burkholderiales bacterium]
MNENDFGRKIVGVLNETADTLPEQTLARLKAARLQALEKAKKPVWAFANFRIWVPAAALMLAVAVSTLWQVLPQEVEVADLDVALLAGDLPVYAYVDKDFGRAVD